MRTNIKSIEKSGVYQEYPNDWIVAELGDLLKRIRNPVQVEPDRLYREIGIRSHGKGLFYKEPVKGSDLGNKSVFWIEEDCLIFNIVFAWEQAVAMTTAQEKGMIASHRFPMWQSKGEVDLNYLHKLLLTPLGKHLLELASPGGAGRNKTLGQEEFNRISVCIPRSLEEQQRIVELLSTWDKAIDLKKRLITEKKMRKQWLLDNLLSGKHRLTGFEGKWEKTTLGKCCIGKACYGLNAPAIGFSENLPRYIRITDIGYNGRYSKNSNVSVDHFESYKHLLDINDIVFARTGASVGKSYLYDINDGVLVYAGFLIRFKVNELIADPALIKNICDTKQYWNWVNVMSSRSGQPGINAEEYASFSFHLPPLAEQHAIARILVIADREIRLDEEHLEEIKKQKRTLMQFLLAGVLRVNEQEMV